MPERGEDRTDGGRNERPGPAEETDTGTVGNADERSSENRRKGLEKDRKRAEDPDDVMPRDDD